MNIQHAVDKTGGGFGGMLKRALEKNNYLPQLRLLGSTFGSYCRAGSGKIFSIRKNRCISEVTRKLQRLPASGKEQDESLNSSS
jgi:hypothetical protein